MFGSSSKEVELVFTGTNRSAVRALKDISDQSTETTDTLKGDADEQTLSFDKTREASSRLRDSMIGLMGMVGIGGVAFGLRDLKDSAVALQSNQAQLGAALKSTGQLAGDATDRLKEMADSMSTHGGFSTTQNLQALTQFVRDTKSATDAQKLLALSTNIARGSNEGLAQAQTVVSRAYAGSARGLQQMLGPIVNSVKATVGLTTAHQREIAALENQARLMGPMGQAWLAQEEVNDHITAQQSELAEMTDKHATAQQVLTEATKYFSGATARYATTTAGHASNLENALHNLTEELGMALLPTMNDLLGVGMHVAEWMAKNKKTVLDLALAFTGLGAAMALRSGIKAIGGLSQDIAKAARAFGLLGASETEAGVAGEGAAIETGIAWDAVISGTVIGLALVALVEMIEHWKQVEAVVVDVWHVIEHAASDAWSWIKTAANNTLSWIENAFHNVEHAIVSPFEDAFRFIEHGFDELKDTVGDAAHWLSHPFGLHFAQGGVVPRYFAGGGPVGTDTVPAWLSPGEGVVTQQGMAGLGAGGLQGINSGYGGLGGGSISITPQSNIQLRTTDRALGEAVVRWSLNRAARGVGNLVGGSLVTGAPGLPV